MKTHLSSIYTLLILLTPMVSNSQDTTAIRKQVEELLNMEYISTPIYLEKTKEINGGKVHKYGLVIDEDLIVTVYEYEKDIRLNGRKKVSEQRIFLMKLVNAEYSTSNVYKDDEYELSASVVLDLPENTLHNLHAIFLKNNLLYELTFFTNEKEKYERAKKRYSKLFMIE